MPVACGFACHRPAAGRREVRAGRSIREENGRSLSRVVGMRTDVVLCAGRVDAGRADD